MNSTELRFERPWLLLLLIPAIVLILLPWLRLPKRRRLTLQKIIPTVIHGLLSILLVLLLAGTSIARITDNQSVILLVDHSDSTLSVRSEMDTRVAELQRLFQKNTSVEVMYFGGDCVASPEENPQYTDASDIAGALEYAASQLPADKAGRIVLFSDGRQTENDGISTAEYLYSRGVRIDCVWFDSTTKDPEVLISDLIAPHTTYQDRPMTFVAELESNVSTAAELALYDGNTLISRKEVHLGEGSKVVSFDVPGCSAGLHSFRLEIEPETDTLSQNNRAVACVDVVSSPSVLIISGIDTDSEPLEKALDAHADVSAVTTAKAPRDISQLCQYDGVILQNVNADDLPRNYAQLLHTYVHDYGRGLLAVGGKDTFMYGSMRGTQFEEMLPVSFNLSRTSENESVALMLVVDCSLSMSQQTSFMSVAKQGTIKCVDSMSANDYVGIISFNQTATVEAPMEKATAEHKANLNRIIAGLTTSKGTFYTDALKLAHQELLKSDAPVRHILFVSDGGPADTGFTNLIPGIVNDGISISTIGLGFSSSLLSDMAENSGGSYYFVKESTDLPDIMLSLTQQISVNSLITGSFTPTASEDSPLAAALPTSLPALNGYLGTTVKKSANVHITVGEEHPLFASWALGNGKVSCFTSDLSNTWSSRWLQSSDLMKALLLHAMPDNHNTSALQVSTTWGGRSAQITVTTPEADDSLMSLSTANETQAMTQISPGVYRGSIPTEGMGGYPFTVTQTSRENEAIDMVSQVVSVSASAEHNVFGANGQALMTGISTGAGGILTDTPTDLAKVDPDSVSVVTYFRVLIGILFTLLLLADIGIRKLRWKDLRNLALRLKHRKN